LAFVTVTDKAGIKRWEIPLMDPNISALDCSVKNIPLWTRA